MLVKGKEKVVPVLN